MTNRKIFECAAPHSSRAAAPGGGAAIAAWGCAFFLAWSGAGFASEVPSGHMAELKEALIDTVPGAKGEETWLRLRFVMPALDPQQSDLVSYSDVEADFLALCRETALPYARQYGLEPDKITITLMSAFVEFGTTDPGERQMIEVFRPKRDDCIWEAF